MGDFVFQDLENNNIEFIEITNRGVGKCDESGGVLIIKEPDPKQIVSSEYEVISNKVVVITSGSTNTQYPSALAVYNMVITNADKHFSYTQNIPANIWYVNHGLGKKPSVITTDSAGTTVEGMVKYIDLNNVSIEFSVAFSGYAELN